jgi:cation diffusion facilitator family transporter
MSERCCSSGCATAALATDRAFRRVLWIALAINAVMFAVELLGGLAAGSVSLLADALDFFGDAANYGVSLFALSLGALWRARAALLKGLTMTGYALLVLGGAGLAAVRGTPPEPVAMGAIGMLALLANVSVALILYRHRNGDANRRSVWLCSRNDVIGNVAVMLAALGVFGTGSGWPDWLVGVGMGALGLSSGMSVVRQSGRELRQASAIG